MPVFQRFVNLLQRLWARLSWTGGVHYLNGGPGLPPPLTPEEEKALLARMADLSLIHISEPTRPY